jgi:hypothetical protein
MATFNRIAGQEPSTISFKARTIQHSQNSSNMQQEIISIGDPENPNSIARNSSVAPKSTDVGLVVRIAGGPSSAADCVIQTQGNSTVIQGTSPWVVSVNSRVNIGSTAADNAVTVSGNSTVVVLGTVVTSGDSTCIQGTNPWVTSPNSTAWVKNAGFSVDSSNVLNVKLDGSTVVTIRGNSTVTINNTSVNIGSTAADNAVLATIGTNLQSTAAPSSNSSGLTVRQVIDNILTTASSNAFGASTSLVLQSSAAGIRSYVTAYSITSTVQSPTKVTFMSGSTLIAPIVLAALSSAVVGVNLAVGAPAYLFRTKSAGPLSLNTGNSTVVGFKAWVSYFRAP